MVTNATSLSGSGLRDWIIQRATSVVLSAYFIFLLVYLICHPNINFYTWSGLFSTTAMKVFTLLALLSMVLHAWVGAWTISTDYFTERMQSSKAIWFRLFFQSFFALLLLVYLIWGIQIIWGL
ncbi:MAG: succinate dehydrogenase, hydrophobic membrane anchor protein [Endozoicomonadaceae bacterium]|nr:succinate dehydrogenase, hydrophobic membrane anchor protein [Endozoicomonadaceae bacterium]